MSSKNWAPGFIWVTPRLAEFKSDSSGKCSWHFTLKPPMLIQVSQITDLVQIGSKPDRQDIAKTLVSMTGNAEACFEVTESPHEIADLIRDNWEKRISGEAAMGAEYGSGDYKIGKDGKK